MKCPKCSSVLKKKFYEKIEVEKCDKCKGTWLDAGELTKIIETDIEKFDTKLVQETLVTHFAGIPLDEQRSVENCPVCQKAMRASNYDYQSGIIIDTCVDGHGVWLDDKELEKVQIYREHWSKEADKYRGEWLALVKNVNDAHADVKKENQKRKMRPTQYLISSMFKKILGV